MEVIVEQLALLFSITLFRYLFIAGVAFLIFYKLFPRRMKKNKIQGRSAGKADFIREVGYSVTTSLIFAVIGFLVLYTPFKQYTLVYDQLDAFPWWYLPVSVVLSLVIHDTYFYWMHRLLHHRKIFRLAHLVHHKSTNPSPFASYSFHFIESIAEGGILVLLPMVLPMHPLAIMLFIVIGFIINVYGHLGYEIMPRWVRHSFLFQVINTSVHHNLHHSKFKGNYGLYFRHWDRLRGTEHPDYVKEYDRVQAQRFARKKEEKETQPAPASLRA
ncbi:sterol desaturase family protein [Aridibaculum aurantiacum]|uniref:sterol desaturase family protein n=1 Tax=Aridibaculum aurantiacum TaxID=2810307 RepID=UPI001A962451|nr:sterol desaturase family protein [Aridibaculum aurantiacum]